MLDSIGGVSRYDFLLRQFQYENICITEDIQQSLETNLNKEKAL